MDATCRTLNPARNDGTLLVLPMWQWRKGERKTARYKATVGISNRFGLFCFDACVYPSICLYIYSLLPLLKFIFVYCSKGRDSFLFLLFLRRLSSVLRMSFSLGLAWTRWWGSLPENLRDCTLAAWRLLVSKNSCKTFYVIRLWFLTFSAILKDYSGDF